MTRISVVTLVLFLITLWSQNVNGLIVSDKQLFARIHRRIRDAAKLPPLKWSSELGDAAFNISVDQAFGTYSKDKPQEGNIEGKFWLSRYYKCNDRNWDQVIETAVDTFRHAQGSRLQLFWPRTTHFGCSAFGTWAAICGLGSYTQYIVCLYQPPIPVKV